MVDSSEGTGSWAKAGLGQLVEEVEKAREEGKYLFLWDKNGNCGMFFKYKGQLVDVAPQMIKKTMGNQTNEDIAEYIRAQLVVGMRTGDKVMLDIDKLNPVWQTDLNVKGVLEPNLLFNRTEWYKDENYLKFVKEEENHSIGGLNPGMYRLVDETFSLTIRSGASTEEEVLAQLKAIPKWEEFKCVIIQ